MTRTTSSAAQIRPFAVDLCRARLVSAVLGFLRGSGERDTVQRGAMAVFAVRVASAGLLYLTQVVLARWMGASEFGSYVLAWTWVLVLGGLSHLGLAMATIRLLPEYAVTDRQGLALGLQRGGRRVALAVGTFVALLGLAAVHLLADRLGAGTAKALSLAMACVPFYALTDLQDGIGRGKGLMLAALVPPYVLRPLILLAVMIAGHEFGLPMSAVTAAGAAVAATVSAALVQGWLVRNRRGSANVVPAFAFRDWLTLSAPLLALYGAELVMQNADVILLAMHRPAIEVGMYFAAAKTMALVMFVHYAVGSAAAHRFSALKARGDDRGLRLAIRDAVRWTFFPSLAAAVAILCLGKPLLWLFSPQFTEAYPVMTVLVVGFLARAAIGPAEFVLNMLGHQTAVATIAAVAALVNVALNFALVPSHGMLGAAVANATALAIAAASNAVVARRRLGLDLFIGAHLRRHAA